MIAENFAYSTRADRRRAAARRDLSELATYEGTVTREGVVHSYATGYRDSYDATRRDRLSTKRKRRGGPADLHLTPLALWDLREISRDLERNSNLVSGAMDRLIENVIYNGFTFSAQTGDDGFNAELNAYLLDWFAHCDSRREFHFFDLLAADERNNYRDGDGFYWLDPDGQNGLGSVAVIEGDRCFDPKDTNDENVVHGIRRGGEGEPLEYFIADEAPRYPLASADSGAWFPVYDYFGRKYAEGGVLHSYDVKRMTQTRGLPWFATCIREVDDVDAILVAERVAMRLSASRATYETIEDPEMFAQYSGADPSEFAGGLPEEDFEPGAHSYRMPGTKFGVVEHNRPGDNFQTFIETQLRLFGLPTGLPIELVLLDFSRPNFSAQRLALQNAHRTFIRRQVAVNRRRVDPIRRFAIARGIATGQLQPPAGMSERAVYNAAVQFPRWPYIRPLEDARANVLQVKNGLKSRRAAVAEVSDGSRSADELIAEIDAEAPAPITQTNEGGDNVGG